MDGSRVIKSKKVEFAAPWTMRHLREEVVHAFNLSWSVDLDFFSKGEDRLANSSLLVVHLLLT